MKTTETKDTSIATLLGSEKMGKLHILIDQARTDAEEVLSHGHFVRAKFQEGNLNSAPAGSVEGSLAAASELMSKLENTNEEPRGERFFGQNIRETVQALRPLWRK